MEAEIGVFGGSGFHSLLDSPDELEVETPFGPPSDKIVLGDLCGKSVAFLPRHGRSHSFPPHKINYRANAWAFKELGVKRVVGPCAVGSLKREIPPGTFVVCDQIVDFTKSRANSFFDGPEVKHLVSADPYCPELRRHAVSAVKKAGLPLRERGAVAVIEGPRFSTRAESLFFSSQGWDLINMTQSPEAFLCAELGMCYCNISIVTDYDAGFEGVKPVSYEEVIRVFNESNESLKLVLREMVSMLPRERSCSCASRT